MDQVAVATVAGLSRGRSALPEALLLVLGPLGCYTSYDSASAVELRDSAGIAISTIATAPNRLREWQLGDVLVRIDGSPAPDLGAPYLEHVNGAFWLSDGRIVVADMGAHKLRVYDAGGKYLESYGGEGEGPSEFARLRTVTVSAGDTIFVYDSGLRSMKLFHPDVGFVRSMRLPGPRDGVGVPEVWRLAPGRFAYHIDAPDVENFDVREAVEAVAPGTVRRLTQTAFLYLLGEGQVLGGPIPFDGPYSALAGKVGNVRLPFAYRPVIFVGDGRLLYGSGQDFQLTELDSGFRPRRVIRWPSLVEPIRSKEIELVREELFGSAPSRMERIFLDVMFSEDLLPDYRPALGRSLMDADGRIWVSRFEPLGRYETVWYILDVRGVPVARLELPREMRARLVGVSGARVLLVTRDALGVFNVEIVGVSTAPERGNG